MQLTLKDNLPFATINIKYQGKTTAISDVLIDTGSAGTLLSSDIVSNIGITPQPEDTLLLMRGIGGTEAVFLRNLDCLELDGQKLPQFEIEVGAMDYGFEINGILGMDALIQLKAVVNLKHLTLEFDI